MTTVTEERSRPGRMVHGVVIDSQRWGMQVRLSSGELGFIDVTDASDVPAPRSTWPEVGDEITALVKRYNSRGRLRLSLRRIDLQRLDGAAGRDPS